MNFNSVSSCNNENVLSQVICHESSDIVALLTMDVKGMFNDNVNGNLLRGQCSSEKYMYYLALKML